MAARGYGQPTKGDSRIDFLRGLAIVFVVVNHLGMTSLFQLLTQEAVGFVPGAELFVLFSGLVVGMVYGLRVKEDFGKVVDLTSRRAGKLYLTALAALVGVFLLSLLPFFQTEALTTYVYHGTGGAGHNAVGAATRFRLLPSRGLVPGAGVAGAIRHRPGGRLPPPQDRRVAVRARLGGGGPHGAGGGVYLPVLVQPLPGQRV